jgi:ribosomal protein S18 acetylase RimI-like enzyme
VLQPGCDEEVVVTTVEDPVPSSTPPSWLSDESKDGSRTGISYRTATAGDAQAVAALHADSWRRNYRGAYMDSFLDGDVVEDRLRVWRERLSMPSTSYFTIVADEGSAVVGFAHTVLDEDAEWGALLDNLHVAHHLKGTGVGTRLMAETAAGVIDARPGSGVHLWVLEQNTAAQSFYRARGGSCVGQRLGGPFPGGGRAVTLRYAWPDPSVLARKTTPSHILDETPDEREGR